MGGPGCLAMAFGYPFAIRSSLSCFGLEGLVNLLLAFHCKFDSPVLRGFVLIEAVNWSNDLFLEFCYWERIESCIVFGGDCCLLARSGIGLFWLNDAVVSLVARVVKVWFLMACFFTLSKFGLSFSDD